VPRRRGRLLAGIGLLVTALLVVGATSLAGASIVAPRSTRTVVVTVDFLDGRRTFSVAFDEASITGLDALRGTGMEVVTYGSSTGTAVCAIGGVGRASGPGCLGTGSEPYWSYFRNGAYSGVGAGATQVTGGVEQWRWGTSTTPPDPPATTTTTTTRPAPPSPTTSPLGGGATVTTVAPPPPAGTGGGGPEPGGNDPTAPPTSADDGPSTTSGPSSTAASTTTRPGASSDAGGDAGDASGDDESAVPPVAPGANGGGPGGGSGAGASAAWSIVGFLAMCGALGALIVRARRRRAPARTPDNAPCPRRLRN